MIEHVEITELRHYRDCLYHLFFDLSHEITHDYQYTISKVMLDKLGGFEKIAKTIGKILEAGFEASQKIVAIKNESSCEKQQVFFQYEFAGEIGVVITHYVEMRLIPDFNNQRDLSIAFNNLYKNLKNAYLNSPMPDEAVRPWYAGVRDLFVLSQKVKDGINCFLEKYPQKIQCEIKNGTVIHIIWEKELDGCDYRFEICPASFELYRKKDGKEEEVYHKY